MISFEAYYKNSILLSEGGNVFKNANGTSDTDRIDRIYIIPTIKSLEQLTGLSLQNNTLGSTGKKESSGDIDLVVDENKLDKDQFIKDLTAKGVYPTSLKKIGIEVAYKAPVVDEKGNKTGKFVQVDFMFNKDPNFLKFYYANNEDIHKGSYRNILLAAIAKTKGLTLSMKGLSDRETKQLISRDPQVVTKKILGEDATLEDIHNVASVLQYLRKHLSEEEIKTVIEPAEETIGTKLL